MYKNLFVLFVILLLGINQSFAQLEPECNNIIGQATNSGVNCTPFPLNPAIPTAGTPVTRCFSYQFTGPINLGYLLVTGQCGPFPLYNTLSYSIYSAACDSLIASGNIFPFNPSNDTFIDELIPNEWYIICYHWIANCPQTDACPIIYTSLLPIELLSFEVESVDGINILKWTTASEINNDYFVVERSIDGSEWEPIGIVPGAGNSISTVKYIFNDDEPLNGLNYYRLKQIDYNGKYEYSGIISTKSLFYEKFVIMPNPAKNTLNILSVSDKDIESVVEIVSESGEKIYVNENVKMNSSSNLEVDISKYSQGVYFVNILIKSNPSQYVFKFVKN